MCLQKLEGGFKMICSKCGKRILTNAKYCTNCGTKLEYPESKQTVSRGPIPITGPAKKGKGILLGVLGVVIGCAAAVFLILLLIGLAGTDTYRLSRYRRIGKYI